MAEEKGSGKPLPGWAGFRKALGERTLLGRDDPGQRFDTSAVYYPLIGLALGAAAVAVDRLSAPLGNRTLSSLAVVATLALLTRGRPLLGLAKTIAALFPRSAERTIPVLSQTPGTAVTFIAGLIVVAEVLLLDRLDSFRTVGLLFAPMLGHCAMVVTATGSREARADGKVTKLSSTLTFREFGIASTVTFALVFLTTNFLGALLVLVTGITTIGLRMLFHYLFGGFEPTNLAAAGELVQLANLGLLVLL
jgi:adenosylcobinamide-GDP ribazoletransferase